MKCDALPYACYEPTRFSKDNLDLPIDLFLGRLSFSFEQFCVIYELTRNGRVCSKEELADFLSTQTIEKGYVFGEEYIPVNCRTHNDWSSIIIDMECSGLVRFCADGDRRLFEDLYKSGAARYAPLILPLVGDVLLSHAGYSVWRKYVENRSCLYYLIKECAGECGEIVGVYPSLSEDICDYEYSYEHCSCEMLSTACVKHAGYQSDERLCVVKNVGQYWVDRYATCVSGYAVHCFCNM